MSFTQLPSAAHLVRVVLIAALIPLTLVTVPGCGPKESAETTTPANTEAPAQEADKSAAAETGAPLGTVKVGDKALCTVCNAGGADHGPEEVKATLDYKGRTYAFCDEAEKAEFISNPTKYAGSGE